jgi:hypothetical protein
MSVLVIFLALMNNYLIVVVFFLLEIQFCIDSFRIILVINVSCDSSVTKVIGCGLDESLAVALILCHCAHTSFEAHIVPGAWLPGVSNSRTLL